MIVDGKGNVFEDRRKQTAERRKNDFDTTGGRRNKDRRKAVPQVEDIKKKK